ncbi:SDR family NAD(P)-dependent oxidoreductase [Pyrinomonas sp.]|uniref:SDR family NAD(P)-dependent oxidoreductase n=1 Tax=Pyrinomonas sp. TaxID=2080306 RepID=UPI00332E1426
MMQRRLKEKVAIVTGSGRGLGRAIAEKLAREGAAVVLNSRTREQLEAVQREIESFGGRAVIAVGDATNEEDINRIVSIARDVDGRIDILVNNAAHTGVGLSVAEMSVETWDGILRTNLRGPFLFCRAVIPHLQEQRSGRIINIASLSAKNALPFASADAAAKAGLLALTRVLAAELGPHNITVNAVVPGLVPDTELAREFMQKLGARFGAAPEAMEENMRRRALLGRHPTALEIAEAVAFLASDAASSITAQSINVCGGMSVC